MTPLKHELFSSYQVVNLDRSGVVSLNRSGVVNFTGFCTLLGETSTQLEKKGPGRPVTQFKEITKTSQEVTKEGETRAMFIVKVELLDKVKAIANWDRILFKNVINSALEDAINKHEKKNGDIKPIPKK